MKKILVIEDSEPIRENIAEILELAGYQTVTACNGKEGVELAERELPDLVLCDVMMPVLDGFGVLKILQSKPHTTDIPVIFLTAKTEKTDIRYGMNLGAEDYITKPFEQNELLSVIELRLKKYSRLQKKSNIGPILVSEQRALQALDELTREREMRHFSRKSEIYTEGGIARNLFLVRRGKVKIFKTNDDGKEFITEIVSSNGFFGHWALLSGEHYSESATTIEDADLVLIPKDEFIKLLHSDQNVAAKIIKTLARDVVSHEDKLLQLAYNSVRKRIANALIHLHELHVKDHSRLKGMSILREDIAAMVGTAKETVIRTIADFKEEHIVEIEEGKIFIRNLEKLKRMFN